ncbi:HD-GYP domain-containing protein [Thermospira aquatica]|uniref:HD domain-containing protein n=1 Tax=Thermospira aquatica TaxID=2828656 RepID=A0AAX3BBZ8_9SPIR|nr:HD domain-containing phosphohydrolase [Thermospira aquatica]URA09603.1 HD domain-containing protein [Thermospira aquatica]
MFSKKLILCLAVMAGLEVGWSEVTVFHLEEVFLGEVGDEAFPKVWSGASRLHWAGVKYHEVWFRTRAFIKPGDFFYIPSVDHEITLYVDREKCFSSGDPELFSSSFSPVLVDFKEVSGEKEILLRVRSRTYFLGIPRIPLLLGQKEAIIRVLVQRDVFLWFIVALIFFSALAELAVFFWLNRFFVSWLFGFAVTIAVYLSMRSLAKWWILGNYPFLYGYLELWSLFLIPFFVWRMVIALLRLDRPWHRWFSYTLFGFWVTSVMWSLFDFQVLVKILYPFEFFLLVFLPFLLGFMVYHGRKNRWALEVLPGFCVLGITAVLDVLREQGFLVSEHIYIAYGWVAVFVNFLVVATRQMIAVIQENRTMLKEIQGLNIEIVDTQREIVLRLSEIAEARSRETGNHVRRVSEYAALIARMCGLSEEEISLIRLTAPMHDIGKLAIPDAVLHKSGKLTSKEFELIKKHTLYGYEMLKKSSRPIFKAAAIIALEHHERMDGKGYPHGKKGEDIHLYARITAVADVFDSLSSDRCYKKAWPWDEVVAYMKANSGTQLDARLVEYLFSQEEKVKQIQKEYMDFFEGA